MKRLKRIMALVIAMAMVLSMMSMTAFADGGIPSDENGGPYTITVKNTNENVSIRNQTYTAYKLFESRYVAAGQAVSGGSGYEDAEAQTTPYSQDNTPHAYYIKKGSPFFGVTAGSISLVDAADPANGTKKYQAAANSTGPVVSILEYFDLIEIPGQDGIAEAEQLVLVQPKDTYNADKAYELSQKLTSTLDAIDGDNTLKAAWSVSKTAANDSSEEVTIDVSTLGAGYYLVRGEGKAYKEGETAFDDNPTGKTVAAAVALTTTDPAAEIIAKLDATKVDKQILEDTDNNGTLEEVKFNDKSIGDTVSYVVKAEVPNLTGYEKYFFIMNDTLSQGLTLNDNSTITDDGYNDGFVVKFVHKTDTTKADILLTRNDTATPSTATSQPTKEFMVEKSTDNTFKVILKNFIQYKGDLITQDMFDEDGKLKADKAPSKIDGTKFTETEITQSMIGTYTNPYQDYEIQIIYSATVNEDAKIGSTGNENTATLQYSNKPDVENNGEPGNVDKPNETDEDSKVTEITPESKTVTYVTGLKVLKYTQVESGDKVPLAGAKFTFTGPNLKNIVTKATEYYEEAATGGTVYKLTGDRYTEDAPTPDTISGYVYDASTQKYIIPSTATDSSEYKITYGTVREYVGYQDVYQASTVATLHGDVTVYLAAQSGKTLNPGYKKTVLTETTYQLFEEDASGTYYALNNGSYTTVAPTATTSSDYVDTTKKYKDVYVTTTEWENMTAAEKAKYNVMQTVTTDANGIILLRGLGEGRYYLTEIEAPDGYNLLKQPIEFKIEWEKDEDGNTLTGATPLNLDSTNVTGAEKCKWKISYKNKDAEDVAANWTEITQKDEDGIFAELLQMDVENKTGVELPSTGGIGTTIFYVVGAMLVVGAGVILITRRRMDA